MDILTYILSSLSCLCCCAFFVLIFLAAIGMMVSRKKGKKKTSMKEAITVGADVSRAFIRGDKTREQLLAEAAMEDDDDDE